MVDEISMKKVPFLFYKKRGDRKKKKKGTGPFFLQTSFSA